MKEQDINIQKEEQEGNYISKQEQRFVIVELVLAIPLLLSIATHLYWMVILPLVNLIIN